ncbi:MAG TPA: hypothetical protein VL308_24485 [Gemmatimonadaceae bacterium]|jgi:hypothetical protein|nr:hypothetical protein [Gemmatimonadaceae bacterium]
MIMADVWKILFLILGTQAVMVSYWLLAAALFPDALRRARAAYDQRSGRVTAIGLATAIPALLAGAGLLQAPNPILKLIGGVLVSAPIALGLVGSAGLCDRIGAGLPGDADVRLPWRRVLRGGIVLSFAFVLPVLGWFVLLPWTLVSGVGASLGSLRRRPAEAPRATTPAQIEAIQ